MYLLRLGPHWGLTDEAYAGVMTGAVKLLGYHGRA